MSKVNECWQEEIRNCSGELHHKQWVACGWVVNISRLQQPCLTGRQREVPTVELLWLTKMCLLMLCDNVKKSVFQLSRHAGLVQTGVPSLVMYTYKLHLCLYTCANHAQFTINVAQSPLLWASAVCGIVHCCHVCNRCTCMRY